MKAASMLQRPVVRKTRSTSFLNSPESVPQRSPESVEDIRDAVSRLRPARIIAVAADLFYDHGFGNTTLDAVAKKLNRTKPFIYAHFGSKGELLTEFCSGGMRASLGVLNRVVALDETATYKVPPSLSRACAPDTRSSFTNFRKSEIIFENKKILRRRRRAKLFQP
jgi:AcrR family transcriptional regulator